MAHWSSSESGILRKKKKDDDIEKLLIFGYACKLFKDDEKALHIDQGKHLIPWMGDEKIKIDRYDCRGHLSDLSQYEASRQDYDATRWLGLSENERKLEQLCDEERYYSLLNNEEEEEMYKEEELKRNKTNEFQYSYDVPTNPEEKEGIPTVPENDIEETYVPSPDLDVPVDIVIPKTVKEYTRIEKTAIFVSTQGPQMEILIKAKQSDNPQFNFLNQNDTLYKFYRHVLDAVKSRRYRTPSAKPDLNASNTSTDENNDHYLHPSLVPSTSSSTEVPPPTIPSIPYRPNVNCAYSQLVSRIQGTPIGGEPVQNQPAVECQSVSNAPTADGVQPDLNNLTYEQQQYYQYYMQRQYYEYYKQMMENSGVTGDAAAHSEMAMNPNMQAFVQQMMYAQYFQHSQAQQQQQSQATTTNPYAQIVSNLCKDMPNPPAEKPDISKEPVIYNGNEAPLPPSAADQQKICNGGTTAGKPSPKKAALSLLQNYATDSEEDTSEDEQETHSFKMPDEETRVVIDKMASYVVKNGEDFEKIVKSRQDPRFVFLREDHEFYRYYRHKVNEEKKKVKVEDENKTKIETKDKEESKMSAAKVKEKKVIAPVSFSIKKPKEDPPKEIKSALPVDEETDEEEMASQEDVPVPPVIPQPPTLVSSNTSKKIFRIETSINATIKDKEKETKIVEKIENKDEKLREEKSDEIKLEEREMEVRTVTELSNDKKEEINGGETSATITPSDILDKDDPILEMIDLTEDEKNIDLVKNADIFDLASEKEKTAKENRALQLERRKKALAFLKLKSASIDTSNVPDGAKTTIPTIDLSNVHSPKKKSVSSDSSDEEDRRRHRKRSKTKDRDHHRYKRSKESERSVSRKDRERNRKSRTPRVERNDSGVSEKEEGEMSEDTDDTRYKKSSHKKKKSHKRKRSKSKHRSKSKKKSKKRDTRTVPSCSSDTEDSIHS